MPSPCQAVVGVTPGKCLGLPRTFECSFAMRTAGISPKGGALVPSTRTTDVGAVVAGRRRWVARSRATRGAIHVAQVLFAPRTLQGARRVGRCATCRHQRASGGRGAPLPLDQRTAHHRPVRRGLSQAIRGRTVGHAAQIGRGDSRSHRCGTTVAVWTSVLGITRRVGRSWTRPSRGRAVRRRCTTPNRGAGSWEPGRSGSAPTPIAFCTRPTDRAVR